MKRKENNELLFVTYLFKNSLLRYLYGLTQKRIMKDGSSDVP